MAEHNLQSLTVGGLLIDEIQRYIGRDRYDSINKAAGFGRRIKQRLCVASVWLAAGLIIECAQCKLSQQILKANKWPSREATQKLHPLLR